MTETTTVAESLGLSPPFAVALKWYTPRGDAMIAHMARVSNSKAKDDDPAEKLIGYLLRNHHWSPFEMANLCLEITTQRDISAQILRHRSFSFQEFSTRYAEVEQLLFGSECRFQDWRNRQNSISVNQMQSGGGVYAVQDENNLVHVDAEGVDETVSYFDAVWNETITRSLEAYQELLRRGVAKEVARRVLPIGAMFTRMYMNGTVRSWLHYCSERTKPGVQKEHRLIALHALSAIEQCFPQTVHAAWDAGLFQLGKEDHDYYHDNLGPAPAFTASGGDEGD